MTNAPPSAKTGARTSAKTSATAASEDLLGKALDRTLLRRIFSCVWPYKRLLLAALLLLPAASAFELAQPYLLKKAIDEHISIGRLPGLDRLGLLYLLMLVGQYGTGFLHLTFTQIAGQRAMNDLRARVYGHTMALTQAFFDRTPIGRLMTRMTSDIESLTEMFSSGLVSLAGDAIKLTFILIAIFSLDWRLALFSMVSAPLLFGVAAIFRRIVREAFRDIRTKLARMNSFLQEHLSGMKVVQAFAQESLVADRFEVINRDYRQANARAIGADAALYSIVEAVGSFAVAGLLWHGGARIHGGTLTFGVLVAFIEYLSKFFAPIRDLSTKYTVMQQAMAAAERVFALLDTHEPDAPTTTAARGLPASSPFHVELDHVSFAYRADNPVMKSVSLGIRPGETVAIVGSSGAGKSTLVRLLCRLYEPTAGRLLLSGRDIRTLPPGELRRRVVMVAQDPFLFSGTIASNIGLGAQAATPARMTDAAVRVGAGHLLTRNPEGLDASVGERGNNFSAGERQLLSFARALCRDPEILVLDEATASVDPETERLIERGIVELMRGRTSIVIAHRFSTIARADRIVVMNDGQVAEEGTHDQLLTKDGVYAHLHRLQGAGTGANTLS